MLPLETIENRPQGPEEIEERHLLQGEAGVGIVFFLLTLPVPGGRRPGPDPLPEAIHLGQGLCRLLQPPVLEQAFDELPPGILFGLAGRRRAGQEQTRLDLDEHRRLVDELRGDVQIELLHEPEVLLELIADRGHRDVGDLHLVDPHEVQEQIERPLEDRELYAPRGRQTRDRRLRSAHREASPAPASSRS